MRRRNFIGGLLAAGASFFILPGANRIWVPDRTIIPGGGIFTRCGFEAYLIDMTPRLDSIILDYIKPSARHYSDYISEYPLTL